MADAMERIQTSGAELQEARILISTLRQNIAERDDGNAAAIEALETKHAAKLKECRDCHTAELDQLSKQHASALPAMRSQHASELGSHEGLAASTGATLSSLKAAVDAAEARAQACERQLREAASQHAAEPAGMKHKLEQLRQEENAAAKPILSEDSSTTKLVPELQRQKADLTRQLQAAEASRHSHDNISEQSELRKQIQVLKEEAEASTSREMAQQKACRDAEADATKLQQQLDTAAAEAQSLRQAALDKAAGAVSSGDTSHQAKQEQLQADLEAAEAANKSQLQSNVAMQQQLQDAWQVSLPSVW